MAKLVLKEGSGEVELLASRFDAVLFPFSSVEEFDAMYKAFKKRFPKADHYPYAYIYDEVKKTSDDGEPSGAAGRGYLALLETNEIVRGALICARYFGGRELGLPRLHRTFMAAAEEALKKATYGEFVYHHAYRLKLSYHDYEALKRLAPKVNGTLSDLTFGESVELKLLGDDKILKNLEERGLRLEAESLGIETSIREIK